MKRISALILGWLVSAVFILPAGAGTLTTNKFLYKPSLGARGDTEKQTFDAGLERIDARLSKEIWVGDPNFGTTLQTATTAIGNTAVILRIPAGTWGIPADLTIPANVTVQMERGAILSIADTKTLTINGSLKAGPYQIIAWAGSGKVKFASGSPQIDFYPEWWGAVGDNSTDDLAAFKAAVACIYNSSKGNLVLSRMYKLSDTLSINDFNSVHTAWFKMTGTHQKRAGFTSEAYGYPAIELIGSWNAQLSHFMITGSGTAGKIPSVGILTARSATWNGNSDNRFHHLAIYGSYQVGQVADLNGSDNRYDHLETYTSCPVTDNHWQFGFCFDGKGTGDYTPPFSLTNRNGSMLTGATAQSSDNSCLVDSGIMHTGAVPTDAAAVYMSHSWGNLRNVYIQSLAGATSDIFRMKDCSNWTIFHCPIESTHRYTFNITSTSPTSTCANIVTEGIKSSSTPSAALITDGNTELKNCNFDLTMVTGGNIQLGGGASTSSLELNRSATSFTQSAGVYTFQGNRLRFGASMTNLDINPSGYAKNNFITDLRAFAGGPVSGGQTTIDGDVQLGQPKFVTPNVLTTNIYKMTWASAAPTTGSWAQGSIIWNTAATAGGSPGWVCVLNNTFGTLNGGATTGSITTGTNLLTVNSATGLTIGNFIDVAADGGGQAVNGGRVVNINATTKVVTLAGNAAATATGTAVSFHNQTTANAFKAMGNLQ